MQTSANEAVQMHFEVSSQRIAYYRANLTVKRLELVANCVVSQKLAVSAFVFFKEEKSRLLDSENLTFS